MNQDGGSDRAVSTASLLLRIIVGFTFLVQGGFVFGWFGGVGGLDGKTEFLEIVGYESARLLAVLLTITELGAGLLFLLGLLTPLAAAAVIGISFNLIFGLVWSQGLLGNELGPGYLPIITLAVAALAIPLIGSGRFSLDQAFGWEMKGHTAGLLAVGVGVVLGALVLIVLGPGLGGVELPPYEG